jgi:hypothetical protein
MNDRLGIAWNAGLQAQDRLFKGEWDRAQALIDEGNPHAVDINDVVVRGYIQALRGVLIALRDEDYPQARSLIEAAYPPGSSPDFRLFAAPFGMVLVACGLHNYQVAKPYVDLMLVTSPFNNSGIYVPYIEPYYLLKVVDDGQHDHATKLLRAFLSVTQSFLGLPFPMEWAMRWGFITRLRAKLEASLGPEGFQAAWEQGAQLTMIDLADELDRYLGIKV